MPGMRMSRMGWIMHAARWGLVAALGACAGTETGNPSFEGSLGYDAYSSAPRVVALPAALRSEQTDRETPEIEVDNAWLVLGEVELLVGNACDTDTGTHVHGLGAGDHAGGQASPTHFALQPGTYCGLSLPLELGGDGVPAAAPEPLHSESVLITGRLADGTAFEVHSQLQTRLTLRGSSAFVLDGEHAGVVIGFDVARWLMQLPWQDAARASQEKIIVDDATNRALLMQFEAALPAGVVLFRDRDGDGELDADPEQIAAVKP